MTDKEKPHINVSQLKEYIPHLSAGDEIYLSGRVYTARDAAHKRIFELIDAGKELPFDIPGAVIYFAGPTPERPGHAIGSCGPTTSSRMDGFTPCLMDMGLCATIGKGGRSDKVRDAIVKNCGIYLCALGGAGALASKCITSCKVIAFEDLGCESVKELEFSDFPLYVGIDFRGKSIFEK